MKLTLPMQLEAMTDQTGKVKSGWYLFFEKLVRLITAPYSRVIPASGATVSVPSAGVLILAPAGTLAALTLALPTGFDGQIVALSTTQAVTAVTWTNGTVVGPTALSVNQALRLIYDASAATWYVSP